MNYRMILSLLGDVLLVIGAFLLLPCIVAVIYGEPELWVLLATAAGSGLLGGLFILLRPKRRRELHARDGFVMVALSWILISLVGAIPFTVSGAIPSYLDAVFETMSGFTTTGASILRAVEDPAEVPAVLAQLHPLARRHGRARIHAGHRAAVRREHLSAAGESPALPSARWCRRCARPPRSSMPSTAP